jgi:hypothetical protein
VNGNELAVVIRATAEACHAARAYQCAIHLQTGGRNPITLNITPDGTAQLAALPDEAQRPILEPAPDDLL